MSEYSGAEKFLHRFYLSNPFISKASFEIEESLFGETTARNEIEQIVFVSGLARSGTTALMRKLYETGEYASLTYNNMPFLFMPNLWKNKKTMAPKQRAHQDGILVNSDSPEEFDEYFWKVFLKDRYIRESLTQHDVPSEVLMKYQTYISLICKSQNKRRYLSKNNNNVLRIDALEKLENAKIIFLYRHPLDHSSSLLKLHLQFTEMQKQEPFILEYFNYLGHHEFGLGHKPFLLTGLHEGILNDFSESNINYWLCNWMNYYSYLLENKPDNALLVSFEDMAENPESVFNFLFDNLIPGFGRVNYKKYDLPKYEKVSFNPELLSKALLIYDSLNKQRAYK